MIIQNDEYQTKRLTYSNSLQISAGVGNANGTLAKGGAVVKH
jgi:hypothetical protein